MKSMRFTPKPVGMNALPMVVYIPGNGELGEVEWHFHQPAIFARVTPRAFQEKYPCFLLALTPPHEATTLLGGMPDRPTALQAAIRDSVRELAGRQKRPKVDLDRLYLTVRFQGLSPVGPPLRSVTQLSLGEPTSPL